MNESWGHGYYVANTYTTDYYKELAPNLLDFAVLLKGFRPPRVEEGSSFQYLELGCGTGLGLCLLAAAYPEGQFIGVDFHPDHIVQATEQAKQFGLTNIRFIEADFLELDSSLQSQGMEQLLQGSFHYVVAHGIISWVSSTVQSSLLRLASRFLSLGGIFYCSYNTYPGWLALSNYQHLVKLEHDRCASSDPVSAIVAAHSSLTKLLGRPESPTALSKASPRLLEELKSIQKLAANYLAHEYACEDWAPLRVADLHKLCSSFKLRFVSTATLPEIFDDLLADQLKLIVLDEQDPLIRQTLLDLATNKYFRRDLFVRGIDSPPPRVMEQLLGQLRFRLQEAPNVESYHFSTCFGEIIGHYDGCKAIENSLANGPRPLADIQTETGEVLGDLLRALGLLMHVGRIGLDRGKATRPAKQSSHKVNRAICRMMQDGYSFNWLIAPTIGTCVNFNLVEHIIKQALSEGLDGDVLVAYVLMGLSGYGVELTLPNKEPISDVSEQRNLIRSLVEKLRDDRLPALEALGVFSTATKS